ncbi:MAG: UDP-3-O-acyl-N-acetylglucosamine deacetylase [Candidatus Lustribacter sp.]
MQNQATLRNAIEFSGVGLHTGRAASVRVLPAPAGSGLRFRLDGAVEFPAHPDYVVDTRRATVLGLGEHRVSTVEHLLSALSGTGITNALIAVDGPEIPASDGSALEFTAAIDAAGILEQPLACARTVVREPQVFRDGSAVLAVLPAAAFRVRMTIDFPAPVGAQYLDYDGAADNYRTAIAPNRTFGFRHEVEALLERGLAMGGSLDNAVVFDTDGPLVALRAANEPVRHKVLDLIGDFALLGAYPQCEVIAVKSGHALHFAAVRALVDRVAVSAASAG